VAQPEESPVVMAFRKQMASEEARKQYRRRGRIVEFYHAWIKSKLGLRQFHVRGLAKVEMEMLWACLTYNLQQWIRLS
jgi:IS5 family transposase